jgi:osmotically-inducible protein OsmY
MYTLKRYALVLASMSLLLVSLLVSAGCTESDKGASTTSARGGQYTAGQANDKALAEKVEKALRADPALKDAPDVAVEASDGQAITLGGTVPNEERAKRAIEIARSVEGVSNVQDKMVRSSNAVEAPATLHQSTTTEAPLEEKLDKPKTDEDTSKTEEPGPQ